jgi:hypothetical protein
MVWVVRRVGLTCIGHGASAKGHARVGLQVAKNVVLNVNRPMSGDLYLRAGPREIIHFKPDEVKAAIVTCGGLCPGLNTVIREVVNMLHFFYGGACARRAPPTRVDATAHAERRRRRRRGAHHLRGEERVPRLLQREPHEAGPARRGQHPTQGRHHPGHVARRVRDLQDRGLDPGNAGFVLQPAMETWHSTEVGWALAPTRRAASTTCT